MSERSASTEPRARAPGSASSTARPVTRSSTGAADAVSYSPAAASKYPMSTPGIVSVPGARGISTYSHVRVPVTPASVVRRRSVASGGKASTVGGKASSGGASAFRLPEPETSTRSVTASFAARLSRSTELSTASSPTSPENCEGRPSAGRGRTSMSTGREAAPVETTSPNRELRLKKFPNRSSNGSRDRRCTRTWASIARGSSVLLPGPVGYSATFRITAVAYATPSRTTCSTCGCCGSSNSSTQNPAVDGSRVTPYELTLTRVYRRYSTMTGSFSRTCRLFGSATTNRSSGPIVPESAGRRAAAPPVAGGCGAGGAEETRRLSGSVVSVSPPASTVTGPISHVPSAVAWNRYETVSETVVRPFTIWTEVCVPLLRNVAKAPMSGSAGS